MEADLEVRPIEDDAWVGLRRPPEGREAGNLLVVVGAYLEAIEGGSPEASDRRRSAAINDELSQSGHAAILAAGTTELNNA